ncbi:MAG TPA: RNA-binding protein [Kofleriaceae bacterium]|nr:RNA-binding protein [Kofleriaceae bacterium]
MNNRLYVGNLSFSTTEETIRNTFAEFGEVVEAKLMIERETGRSRGFAFVQMATAEGAKAAIEQMNGALLDGRPLRVNEAEQRPERGGGGGGGRGGGGYGGGGGGYGGGGGGRGGRGGRDDRRGGGNRW